MRNFLKFVCIGLLMSVTLAFLTLSSRAEYDLTEDNTRWMNTGESFRTEVYLFQDEPIAGTCSNDCYDVDLTLYEISAKRIVAKDHGNTTTPMVNAPYEGSFVLQVGMENCARSGGCRTWIEYGGED